MKWKDIKSDVKLKEWLDDKPEDWAQIIAVRVALRALPFMGKAEQQWLQENALSALRAIAIAWAARNTPADDKADAIDDAAYVADAIYTSAASFADAPIVAFDAFLAVKSAIFAATFASATGPSEGAIMNAVHAAESADGAGVVWLPIRDDCDWLTNHANDKSAARILTRRKLWVAGTPWEHREEWIGLARKLSSIDPNYSVWIDWYERRIRGERDAFDIPGDKYRKEDKKILRRLAEATDEDFWGKGHEYVNATLIGWLDEACARLSPKTGAVGLAEEIDEALALQPAPPQEPGAIAYGVNEQGKLDRLPNSYQAHLRDVPDQRRAYDDLREAAAELLSEGQRLGHRLKRALDRFLHSLPEGFEDAEAYLLWRDANALRRLHRAHREAAKSPEPDEARLEPVIAEGLGGVLDLYNNFAFADNGLRAKDEARISPQERASAAAEAKAAIPLVNAILAAPDIATSEALDDIAADAENSELPADDPYMDQFLDQSNRTKRNLFAGLISDTWAAFKNTAVVGPAIAGGAAWDGVKFVAATVAGVNYAPLLEFIASNASLLKDYAAIAYSSYPHLLELIERLKVLWLKSELP